MREIVHLQGGQCGNQIGAKVNMTIHQEYLSNVFDKDLLLHDVCAHEGWGNTSSVKKILFIRTAAHVEDMYTEYRVNREDTWAEILETPSWEL